jgi:hypothetical protein
MEESAEEIENIKIEINISSDAKQKITYWILFKMLQTFLNSRTIQHEFKTTIKRRASIIGHHIKENSIKEIELTEDEKLYYIQCVKNLDSLIDSMILTPNTVV